MSEKERLKQIAEIAADAVSKATYLSKDLVLEHGIFNEGLQGLIYQLGYIEGLSYSPEEEHETEN